MKTSVKSLLKTLKFSWKTRKAWWFTATARTNERFARTVIGNFWLGLSNLLSIAALSGVYGTVFKVSNYSDYVLYLGIGLSLWNTVASAILSAPNLFKVNAGNIKNTNTNPIFYTLEEWSFQIQTFLQSFFLVIFILSFLKPIILLNMITSGLIPLLNLIIFMYWAPLLISILGAKFEDLFQLIPIFIQISFLLSPILYEKKALGDYAWIATINPLYHLLDSARESIIGGNVQIKPLFVITFVNLLGLMISLNQLDKTKKSLPFMV